MAIRPFVPLFLLATLLVVTLGNAQTYPPLFGIHDDRMAYDSTFRPKASEVGAKWVRQYVFWSDIEPSAPVIDTPTYDWSKYDSLFLDYKNLGLEVIAVIGGLPSWAATNSYGPILRMVDFKRFIGDLVKRYDGSNGSPEVLFFEFFNEPDLISEAIAYVGWGYWSQNGGGNGADYAQMLKEVFPVVKAANPNAMVVLGGLALENTSHFNFFFLDDVLSSGGGDYFDIMNFHYYTPFEDAWAYLGQDILGKAAYVRNVFTLHGVPQKPHFVTEAGEWSSDLDECTFTFRRNEEIQAQYAAKLFVRGLADGNIKAIAWFILQDFAPPVGSSPCDGTRGLLRLDGSPKAAYYAYKTASNLLQGVTYLNRVSGVDEGYDFSAGGTKHIYVLWNDSGSRVVSLSITSNQVIQVDKLGNQQVVPIIGNRYNAIVSPDPVYLLFEIPPESVSTPSTPSGPSSGGVNIPYQFSTDGSISNHGHPVEYQFDWNGDGTDLSGWGSANQPKTWTGAGTYFVRARARCTLDPSVVSFWSPTLTVRILPPPPPVDNLPFGSFDIPLPGTTTSGAIQVGGWALDDVGVTKVELRSDIPFWPYIGDLYYTCGTRPDVYDPTYPNSNCAGWGYIWLTNFMSDYRDPQTGQKVLEGSTHQYFLRIYDTAGHFVDVGHRNITIRNDQNANPFGAIDGPSPGAIVSGSVNVVGWALARGGQRVSQVRIALGGQVLGQANYGLYRADVEAAFPGYADSGGSGLVYVLNTTLYPNGMYELIGVVTDDGNHQDGIGSRWIYIQN